MTSEILGNGIFALGSAILAALLAIIYQHFQYSQQLKLAREEAIANGKKRIIEDLIRYRYVLADAKREPEPTMHFNAALNAIPIHFSQNRECMTLYSGLGQNFTSTKFETLIIALAADVPLSHVALDSATLSSFPTVTVKD